MNIVWMMNPVEAFVLVVAGVCCTLFAVGYLLGVALANLKLRWRRGKAWCDHCNTFRKHHGDPDSIHLHLCDKCNGVVDY